MIGSEEWEKLELEPHEYYDLEDCEGYSKFDDCPFTAMR